MTFDHDAREGRAVIEGDRGLALRQIGTLFRAGTFAGMSDGQLLEHFLTRHGEAGEIAFAVLIERHGPMVLRVCRGALRSRVDAEDAFQATFLALVRGAGSIRNRESLAPWLHGAALRVSACARAAQERRKAHEGRYASRRAESIRDGDRDDLGAVLHEEVGRLPARYRAAVVLCDLQGLPLVEAAVQLGCPVGTVKSRVARGRERLRARLVRRGVAPAAGVGLVHEASAAIGPALVDATARAAIQLAAGRGLAGMLAASVEYLVRSNSRSILMRRVWTLTASLATVSVLTVGVAGLARQSPGGPGGGGPARQDNQAVAENFRDKSYDVRDLVGTVPQNTDGPGRTVDMSPLIDLISTSVAPGTWDVYLFNDEGMRVGPDGRTWGNSMPPKREGHGRILPYRLGSPSLHIWHTEAVHTQIEDRLRQLRRFVAARQKNEAIESPGVVGMGAVGSSGGMGMMGPGGISGRGMVMGGPGGAGFGGPPPAGRPGMGATGGSGAGMGMAGMMGRGMMGGGSAPGHPGGNDVDGDGKPDALVGAGAGAGGPGGMARGGIGMMPGMSGPGASSGSAPKGASNGSGKMSGVMGGPGASISVMPGAATLGGEGETERRLRALEEKLDRVLKALDVPKGKSDYQKAGGLGP